MKCVPLAIIIFIFCSVNSCSKKDIVIEKPIVEEMIETSIEQERKT